MGGRKGKDTMWVGPELANGRRPYVRENAAGETETGTLVDDLSEADTVVELAHVEGATYEVMKETRLTDSGPSQVASKAYREGWNRTFGKTVVGQA